MLTPLALTRTEWIAHPDLQVQYAGNLACSHAWVEALVASAGVKHFGQVIPMATEHPHARYQWEKQVEGQWRRIDSSVLPEWVKSKKSVRFAAAGGVLSKHTAGEPLERYRLVRQEPGPG